MTYEEFIKYIILYYGKYPNHGENYLYNSVYTFIKKYFKESQLMELLEITKQRYSAQYKMPPDISFFYKIHREIMNGAIIGDNTLKLTYTLSEDEKNENIKRLREIIKKLNAKLKLEKKHAK